MKAKLVKEGFSSSVGTGFSYASGQGGGSIGNQMYVYTIKPLNHTLEPKSPIPLNNEPMHIGLTVKGKKFNDDKVYFGKLIDINRDIDNSIKYYVILDEENANKIKLNPTTVSVIKNDIPGGKVADIWNFSGRGNYFQKKKANESNLVPESLEQLNEEVIGYLGEIEIYKNPKSLWKLEGWERAISDEEGNMYMADTSMMIHTNLLKYLHQGNIISDNARWHSMLGIYVNCIAWQRKDKTDDFYLSESYDETFMKNEKIYKDILDLKELVELTNPQFKFHLKKIKPNIF